ncbi:LacI family transcriptional regulator [Enterococcus faecalis]|nr:LacI family transcriptional regulator [Enterococcus faecalis]
MLILIHKVKRLTLFDRSVFVKKITIKDIAREAGVSIATVSNVINNKANRVSEKKKREIHELMDKYNYAPNLNARSLVAQESKMIGILYYSIKEEIDFGDPFIADLMTGLEFEAKRQGTFILFHGFNELKDIDLLQRNWNFDGFIIIGAFKNIITELVKKISKPMVFIDSYYDLSIQNPQILFVNNDDRKLAYEATKVLLNYGYRNIAFFSPAFSLKDDGVVPQRYLGYLDALLEFGLAADDKLLFSEEKLTNFIEAEETYSASIINSDYLAAQYLYKLRERNQQFKSLISFDNNIFSQLLNPPLSTVDLRQKEKGRIAVKLINDMLQRSEKQFERNIMIKGQLISRESVLERTE